MRVAPAVRTAFFLWLVSCSAGCDGSSAARSKPASRTSPSAAASSIASASPSGTGKSALDQITEEDFEESALLEINADNLEAELDKLEAEIGD